MAAHAGFRQVCIRSRICQNNCQILQHRTAALQHHRRRLPAARLLPTTAPARCDAITEACTARDARQLLHRACHLPSPAAMPHLHDITGFVKIRAMVMLASNSAQLTLRMRSDVCLQAEPLLPPVCLMFQLSYQISPPSSWHCSALLCRQVVGCQSVPVLCCVPAAAVL